MSGQYDHLAADHHRTQEAHTRKDELRAAALVLAAVRGMNGDPDHDGASLLATAGEIARQGPVAPILVDLATAVAMTYQRHIDAGTLSVADIRDLLRASVSAPAAEVAPPGATRAATVARSQAGQPGQRDQR